MIAVSGTYISLMANVQDWSIKLTIMYHKLVFVTLLYNRDWLEYIYRQLRYFFVYMFCIWWRLRFPWQRKGLSIFSIHSVESPSMVDHQWNIWYWGSKWNLHTVCWDAVVCERGTASVYFGITYACFIPSRFPVFADEPQYRLQDCLFFQQYHLKDLYKICNKIHLGSKFEWGL